jgi:S-adenosylmethionine decarboxylase
VEISPSVVSGNQGIINKDGLHILSNFETSINFHLTSHSIFKIFIDQAINDLKLSKVGEAYHDFAGGGFTGVICLAESHLSIHTWPDRNYVTFDIYLSNHLQENSSKAEKIYTRVLKFYEAKVLFENFIHR